MNLRRRVSRVERAVPSALPEARRIELGTTRSTLNFLLRFWFLYFLLLPFLLFSCEREERPLVVQPPSAQQASLQQVSDLVPGPQHNRAPPVPNPDENNSWMMAEGKRFYEAYNCVGCHAHGGGGMGPPLMDDQWVYGYQPEQVFATIVQGRPNGMPSFMGRIPEYQVWQLAAYVRSMSGQARQDAAPGRDDHMKNSPPPNSTDP